MIVQRLLDLQNRFGYLPERELVGLARELGEPLYRVEEVSSFFPAFRRDRADDRPPGLLVRVCRDMTCHHLGAERLTRDLAARAGDLADQYLAHRREVVEAENKGRHPDRRVPLPTEADCRVVVEGVSCLGRCDRGPAVWVERFPMPHTTLEREPVNGGPPLLRMVPKPGHAHGEHAFVYAGRDAAGMAEELARIARGEEPAPDTDEAYRLNTNGEPADSEPPHGRWEIDPYGRDGVSPTYEAVRKVADFLDREKGEIPRPAAGQRDVDAFIKERIPLLARFKPSNLLGMGGGGAPAYTKWTDVLLAKGSEKYIVANGDESEPGTFKDRELLLRTPHLLVEGVILAGLLTGATRGYVYVRHEYHEQIAAVRAEIARAVQMTACGTNIFGSKIDFPVEVFESPGGYICGEMTALIEAMEDKRSQPRNRPPELSTNGLRDKPTLVNNVETLSWAPHIILKGDPEPDYAAAGWRVPQAEWSGSSPPPRFAGRRLFSVSGDVRRPGVYEVPVGLPLGELLESPEYCGGLTGEFTALAPSGPSGGLLPGKLPLDPKLWDRLPKNPDGITKWFIDKHLPRGLTHLDLRVAPLDLAFWRTLNGLLGLRGDLMLGAGIGVYAGRFDVLDLAVNFTRFYRNESCGKCVPCRLGSEKLVRLGTDLLKGTSTRAEVRPLLDAMTEVMNQTSICALGQSAPMPLRSALKYFPANGAARS